MAKKETFILVSLDEDKSKDLAQVITNKTCRQILDHLGSKDEATESEIAKELDLPISTVHYNLQHLLHHKLVESTEFMWSPKGKKMDIYRIAKKLIVIAPAGGDTKEIKSRLKGLIPVALVSVAAAGIIHYFQRGVFGMTKAASLAAESAKGDMQEAVMRAAPERATEAAASAAPAAPVVAQAVQQAAPYALWFLEGAIFSIIMLGLYYVVMNWRKKKS